MQYVVYKLKGQDCINYYVDRIMFVKLVIKAGVVNVVCVCTQLADLGELMKENFQEYCLDNCVCSIFNDYFALVKSVFNWHMVEE